MSMSSPKRFVLVSWTRPPDGSGKSRLMGERTEPPAGRVGDKVENPYLL